MKESIQVAATVEEAVANALNKLDLTHEQVEIEVLQEPKKGFLGIGARDAHVRVVEKLIHTKEDSEHVMDEQQVLAVAEEVDKPVDSFKQEGFTENGEVKASYDYSIAIEEATKYVRDIAQQMGIDDLQLEISQKQKVIQFQLSSSKAALLIGKRGQTLNSLQQLAQLVIQKNTSRYVTLEIDVENYRQKRQEALIELANRLADKAATSGQRVELEPMLPSERKIIHHALSRRLDVDTFSEGSENRRYLVIEPVR